MKNLEQFHIKKENKTNFCLIALLLYDQKKETKTTVSFFTEVDIISEEGQRMYQLKHCVNKKKKLRMILAKEFFEYKWTFTKLQTVKLYMSYKLKMKETADL